MADIHLHTPGAETTVQDEQRVAELVRAGALPAETLFWREGMEEWQSIASFPVSALEPQSEKIAPASTAVIPRVAPEPGNIANSEALPPAATSTRRLVEPEFGARERNASPTNRPLPDIQVAAASAKRSEHVRGRSRFRFRRNPEPLTTIVQVLLVICICVTALELANAIVHYNSIARPSASVFDSGDSLNTPKPADGSTDDSVVSSVAMDGNGAATPADETDDAGHLLLWIGWIMNLVFIVPYFMWLYRTVQNCRNFSSITRFRLPWALWCYFIPPMNLFRPCQVMQEIWRVSKNPRTWHNDRQSTLVGLWWAFTLATGALALSSWLHALTAETRAAQVDLAIWFGVLKIVQLIWYALFLTLVTSIIQKQTNIVRQSRRRAEAEIEGEA